MVDAGIDIVEVKKHIFVINDSAEILDLFQDLLEDEGYRVSLETFRHANMQVQLDQIKKDLPDLIILDFVIGGEDLGWQFLQLLRMDPDTKGIPIIVCTAAVRTIEELGAHLKTMRVAVVLKPFDIDQVLKEIDDALKRYTPPVE